MLQARLKQCFLKLGAMLKHTRGRRTGTHNHNHHHRIIIKVQSLLASAMMMIMIDCSIAFAKLPESRATSASQVFR